MSLLTEQEIRNIIRYVKEIVENSDRALILAAQKAVIEKIKAQGPVAWLFDTNVDALLPGEVEPEPFKEWPDLYTPLYKLPSEGD